MQERNSGFASHDLEQAHFDIELLPGDDIKINFDGTVAPSVLIFRLMIEIDTL